VLVTRRRSIRAAFERAIARGECGRGFDIDLLIDMLTGPFYSRALVGLLPATPVMVNTIVDYVIAIVLPRVIGALDAMGDAGHVPRCSQPTDLIRTPRPTLDG
jgi:hypothetical protein